MTDQQRIAQLQAEIDRLQNELAVAILDGKTAYYRGQLSTAQAFDVRRVEIMAHAKTELAKLGAEPK